MIVNIRIVLFFLGEEFFIVSSHAIIPEIRGKFPFKFSILIFSVFLRKVYQWSGSRTKKKSKAVLNHLSQFKNRVWLSCSSLV